MTTMFVDASSKLGALKRTPQGGYFADATVARVGVMCYSAGAWRAKGAAVPSKFRDSDSVRVYTPASVLERALDGLRAAVVTNDHPPEMVSPGNWKLYSAGNVMANTVIFDGTYLRAQVTLQDANLILDVEADRKTQVSMGYLADTVFEPGVTASGEAYDAYRQSIEYNHLAVVRAGRAGANVRLALDSVEGTEPEQEKNMATMLVIKGAHVDGASAQKAIDELEKESKASFDAVELQRAALATEVTDLREKLATAEAELKKATAKETIDAAVEAELQRRDGERKAAERKAAVAARYPKLSLEGRTREAIDALFETIDQDPDGLRKLNPREPIPAKPEKTVAQTADRPLRGRAAMLASYRKLDETADGE